MPESKPRDEFVSATLLEMDRRGCDRYPCLRRPAVRVLARPSFQSYHAIVRMAFRSTACFEKPFETGTILAIQWPGIPVFSILSARYGAPQQADGTWLLGCTLSRS